MDAPNDLHQSIFINKAVRISNDLYGNDVMSANELAKGYARPIRSGDSPTDIPKDIIDAHDALQARRKLTLVLRSKSVHETPVQVGDTVQVFFKRDHEKRGSWSAPRTVLSYDHSSRTVTVPGKNGRTVSAAVEDVRAALPENDLAKSIQESIDTLDACVDNAIDDVCTESIPSTKNENQSYDDQFDNDDAIVPVVGDTIDVWWPLDKQFYRGTISEYFPDDLSHSVKYDDGDVERLKLHGETWRPAAIPESNAGNTPMHVNEIQLQPGTELTSKEKEDVQLYFDRFQGKEFLLNQAQALPTHVTRNAYMREEKIFKETVKEVHVTKFRRMPTS